MNELLLALWTFKMKCCECCTQSSVKLHNTAVDETRQRRSRQKELEWQRSVRAVSHIPERDPSTPSGTPPDSPVTSEFLPAFTAFHRGTQTRPSSAAREQSVGSVSLCDVSQGHNIQPLLDLHACLRFDAIKTFSLFSSRRSWRRMTLDTLLNCSFPPPPPFHPLRRCSNQSVWQLLRQANNQLDMKVLQNQTGTRTIRSVTRSQIGLQNVTVLQHGLHDLSSHPNCVTLIGFVNTGIVICA